MLIQLKIGRMWNGQGLSIYLACFAFAFGEGRGQVEIQSREVGTYEESM